MDPTRAVPAPTMAPVWAKLEQYGHRSFYARVEASELLGAPMLLVVTPAHETTDVRYEWEGEQRTKITTTTSWAEDTHKIAPGSVFSLRELSESVVRERLAQGFGRRSDDREPISVREIREPVGPGLGPIGLIAGPVVVVDVGAAEEPDDDTDEPVPVVEAADSTEAEIAAAVEQGLAAGTSAFEVHVPAPTPDAPPTPSRCPFPGCPKTPARWSDVFCDDHDVPF